MPGVRTGNFPFQTMATQIAESMSAAFYVTDGAAPDLARIAMRNGTRSSKIATLVVAPNHGSQRDVLLPMWSLCADSPHHWKGCRDE